MGGQIVCSNQFAGAARVAQRSKALEASLQTRIRSKALSQLAVTGRPMRQCTIGPASSGLGEGLSGRDFLVPSRSSDSGRARRMHADTVARCTVFLPTTLVRLASELSGYCVKKQCSLTGSCFGGCMILELCLSRVCTGVAAMGKDYNYQLETMKLGRKKG